MPDKHSIPNNQGAWLKQLDAVRLPIPAERHLQVRRALGDSRRTIRDIADLIQGSPALALAVLREVNKRQNGLGDPAESLEVALTRLGLKNAEALLERLPSVPEADIPPALRQLQAISQHACQQANGLFASRLARLWQDIHWGSLLFLAPLWTLAAAHPRLFEEWERRVLANDEPPVLVERELLGTSLMPLCLKLAERWHLPDWIVQGYRLLVEDRRLLAKALHVARDTDHPLARQQRLDEDENLRRWLTQPANTIVLANGLALSSYHAWDSPHSMRWQRLTALYMQVELDELQQQVHQLAVHSARQQKQQDLWHPAEALLWPWHARRLGPSTETADAPTTQPATSDAVEWKALCANLLSTPSPFVNVLQLSSAARDAVVAGGMRRVMIFVADRTQSALLGQQGHGLSADSAGLKLEAAQSQVVRRLLAGAGQLRLSPANVAQFSPLLPGNLKALFPSEHLVLRSIALNGKVAFVLVADQDGLPLSDASLQIFGKTAQCIERALMLFAGRSARG
ncbi:HDOD domain-containing protein [Pseudomonas matsuisoli]|uniref:HDOD domain-containing protein n=1 Tax=Pseudomonas matsuisoli TaxID=1515666 RepID=A0A917PXJ4_9PSED|nr:HDOD domain-containing protein [Pseudomonas matsuisoli]GGJ97492.1 HDOD domain-containing protein [Pseudomonas matsuisoli]